MASLVPILAGGAGVLLGPAMMGASASGGPGLDAHYRYLSGLLLGIGLAFAASIPDIGRHAGRFRLLCAIVVLGGVGRAVSLWLMPQQGWAAYVALGMELAVTPALTLWQQRVATRIPS